MLCQSISALQNPGHDPTEGDAMLGSAPMIDQIVAGCQTIERSTVRGPFLGLLEYECEGLWVILVCGRDENVCVDKVSACVSGGWFGGLELHGRASVCVNRSAGVVTQVKNGKASALWEGVRFPMPQTTSSGGSLETPCAEDGEPMLLPLCVQLSVGAECFNMIPSHPKL